MSRGKTKLDIIMNHFSKKKRSWDPENMNPKEITLTNIARTRIQRDLISIAAEPLPGIFAYPDESDITKVYAIVVGPKGTPYEGGFFHFIIRFTADYPINPPKVKLITTSNNKVRFNPNLYRDGKVCLSILGTWSGPSWSPVMNLSSLLLSIQSLLNKNPWHNEPGFENKKDDKADKNYNDIIEFNTLRVAVGEMLSGECSALSEFPSQLRDDMEKTFLENYSEYEDLMQKHENEAKRTVICPFERIKWTLDYTQIIEKIRNLYCSLNSKKRTKPSDSDAEGEILIEDNDPDDEDDDETAETTKTDQEKLVESDKGKEKEIEVILLD